MNKKFKKKHNKIIWIVNQFAVSPDMPGGTRHYEYALEFVNNGYEVYILASDFSLQELKYKKLVNNESLKIENVNGVNFVWIKAYPYKKNNFKRLLNWINFSINIFIMRKCIPKPDIVIGSSPQLFTAFAALIIAKRFKVKFISEIRDLWPNSLIELNETYKYHPYTMLLYLLEHIVYHNSEEVIVFTENNRQIINWKGVPLKHIHYISNGVKTNIVINKENAKRLKTIMNINKFTIAYTGAIGIANNIEMLIDVAKELENENIDFVIVGNGPLRTKIADKIKEENLSNIRLFNSIPKSEIYDFLSIVDVCFITLQDVPLFKYGVSPNKLFDYMYAKKPVICSVGGWCNDIIIKAKAGIPVDPDNCKQFIDAVKEMKRLSQSERDNMGENGYLFVVKNFARENLAKKMMKLF